jgi:hypothetical protein
VQPVSLFSHPRSLAPVFRCKTAPIETIKSGKINPARECHSVAYSPK